MEGYCMFTKLRPPAVPLATIDPYFSVWSTTDFLYDSNPKHWTGTDNGMTGMLQIDGNTYRFMGTLGCDEDSLILEQKTLIIKPLSTIYTFEGGGIRLEVNFTTPLLMEKLELLSRPCSYITFQVNSIDGKDHKVKLYFDATGEWCVNTPDQKVTWRREKISDDVNAIVLSHEKQEPLNKVGDNVRIDWGYFYLVIPYHEQQYSAAAGTKNIRNEFFRTGSIPTSDDNNMPRSIEDNLPLMAVTFDFDTVALHPVSKFIALAYDDVQSIEYFHKPLNAYWRRTGVSFHEMLVSAVDEYGNIMRQSEAFNEEVLQKAVESGGKEYADLVALGYRQAIAAHKVVYDEEDGVLFLSKECFSNGCIGTVDVTYPSIPLFLLYNPELVKGMLRPIFRYSNMKEWIFDFAPHDVGCYPKANGQVYGENKLEYQMPVEECGNMLITTAAICKVEGKADFAREHFETLTKWAKYLLDYGFDPGNQLCTDDFAGHLAHNANLSIKAILGICSYANICKLLGKMEEHECYLTKAKEMAVTWEKAAEEGEHYRLTFDKADSWSLKYNLVWDELLGFNLFNPEISRREIQYYLKKQNMYGIPLDSRADYTKTDWIVWSAAMAENQQDFEALISPIWKFVNETPSRVPFTDWYDTITGKQVGFQHRSVIGGIFIKLLKDMLMHGHNRE